MTKQLSSQAAAAKMIRQELKAAFPTVTFSVKSDSFSGGDSVDIDWTDGPTTAQVDAIARKYQYGHFDGMIDLYEYTNRREDIPQSRYVQTQRSYSNEARIAAIEYVNARFGWNLRYTVETSPSWRRKGSKGAGIPAYTWVKIDQESNKHTGHGWQDMEVDSVLHNASLICQHCNAHTLPADTFCPQCGTRVDGEDGAILPVIVGSPVVRIA